jgi:hypothetical protein
VIRRAFVAGALALVTAACAQPRPDPLPGYRPASLEARAAVIRVVSEYYETRNRAAVTGDIAPLYAAHPALAQGEDRRSGVNVEAFFVERMRALGVTRVAVDLEASEPVKVYVNEKRAVAYVHGRETWDLPPGTGQTISEIFVRVDLRQLTIGWLIERTDGFELGERIPPTPR